MSYFEAKMESNGSKAFPCVRPFRTGKVSGKYLRIRTSLYLSIPHIAMSLISFMGKPFSMRIL
jgi:hypothetical protein